MNQQQRRHAPRPPDQLVATLEMTRQETKNYDDGGRHFWENKPVPLVLYPTGIPLRILIYATLVVWFFCELDGRPSAIDPQVGMGQRLIPNHPRSQLGRLRQPTARPNMKRGRLVDRTGWGPGGIDPSTAPETQALFKAKLIAECCIQAAVGGANLGVELVNALANQGEINAEAYKLYDVRGNISGKSEISARVVGFRVDRQ
ncbi:hypothetical protein C8R43DRAFT_963465 [Mycena crocata]|nr:hypothetical protein C8R43DRAFT_964481 [Mycena crocata]KAJ7106138.1 hypothetical protein C8R43DRAFT_963465 [Mycena crocata]